MTDGEDNGSLLPDNNFPYLLIIVVVVAHISIMAIVIYYSCCRKRCCVCRIKIQNNTIHQNSFSETSRINATVAQSDSTDSESLVDNHDRPVRTQDPSFITQVRTRVQGPTGIRTSGTPNSGMPPPYSEGESSSEHVNAGASFEDLEVQLPKYEDIVNHLPQWKQNEQTGCLEVEKPPTYEEATNAKRGDRR